MNGSGEIAVTLQVWPNPSQGQAMVRMTGVKALKHAFLTDAAGAPSIRERRISR